MTGKKTRIKLDLDEIAEADGFIFLSKLGYNGYVLYTNADGSVNRVYDSRTGKIISEYSPRIDKAKKFHTPLENFANSLEMRWYNGKGNRIKRH